MGAAGTLDQLELSKVKLDLVVTSAPEEAEEGLLLSDAVTLSRSVEDLETWDLGDDSVLRQLELFPWEDEKLFASVSLGFGAGRLFCFIAAGTRFPNEEYRGKIGPWIEHEAGLYDESELPREDAGCWHPIFPGRIDDVWMMATAAVKVLESAVIARPTEPRLAVFERYEEDGTFGGIRCAGSVPY